MEVLVYLLKSTLLLSLFFLTYEFLLKKETYFFQNRIFLILGMLTSVILPLLTFQKIVIIPRNFSEINIIAPFETDKEISSIIVEPHLQNSEVNTSISIDYTQILLLVYGLALVFFLGKFLYKLFKLNRILSENSSSYHQNGIKFIVTDKETNPFSFFNRVVYNPVLHKEEELNLILKHEESHVKNFHSIDVILVNLITYLNWFNPLAWLYRKRVNQNLEFLADRAAVSDLNSFKSYQMSLINCAVEREINLPVTHFHPSFLKTRIMMLHQKKSKKFSMIKLGFILPILVVFFFAFQIETKAEIHFQLENIEFTDIGNSLEKDDFQKIADSLNAYLKHQNTLVLNGETIEVADMTYLLFVLENVKFPEDVQSKIIINGSSRYIGNPVDYEVLKYIKPGTYIFFSQSDDVSELKGHTLAVISQEERTQVKISNEGLSDDKKTYISPTSIQFYPSLPVNISEKETSTETNDSYVSETAITKISFKEISTSTEADQDEYKYLITKTTTREEFEQLQKEVKGKFDIDLKISNLNYNDNEEIIELKISFKNKDKEENRIELKNSDAISSDFFLVISDDFSGFELYPDLKNNISGIRLTNVKVFSEGLGSLYYDLQFLEPLENIEAPNIPINEKAKEKKDSLYYKKAFSPPDMTPSSRKVPGFMPMQPSLYGNYNNQGIIYEVEIQNY